MLIVLAASNHFIRFERGMLKQRRARGKKSRCSRVKLRSREIALHSAIDIPADIGIALVAQPDVASLAAWEAVAIEAYRSGNITLASYSRLESQAQAQLHHALIVRLGRLVLTEEWGGDIVGWRTTAGVGEIGTVGYIEHVPAELQICRLTQPEGLGQ